MTFDEYLASIADDRRPAFEQLCSAIRTSLPPGFEEVFDGRMVNWVVPHSAYPAGYHCDPKKPLPFISLASQKNYIAMHHLGLYGDPGLLEWFQSEWPKATDRKLDMGKGCVRFKKPEDIPYGLIGSLASRVGPEQWVERYEAAFKR
jgi:hypothetical protein